MLFSDRKEYPSDIMDSLAARFAGFSLEKRQEWKGKPWRCRVLPNKTERQEYRIEVYGETSAIAIFNAYSAIEELDAYKAEGT